MITAAERVEHSEISSYRTARDLARHLGEIAVARLLANAPRDEQCADLLLTAIADPLLQQVCLTDMGPDVELTTVGGGKDDKSTSSRRKANAEGRRAGAGAAIAAMAYPWNFCAFTDSNFRFPRTRFRTSGIRNWSADATPSSSFQSSGTATGAPGRARTE